MATADPTNLKDEQLAALLDELTDAAARGDHQAADALCEQRPELADPIRELWGAVMLTQAVADSARTATYSPTTAQHAASSEFELPMRIGDYQLQEEIGRGGMGVVFRAQQLSLSRRVAVKLILRGALASLEDQQRFRAEAEAAAKLEHPGIVPIYEIGDRDGQLFFSMALVEGQTLAERVAKGPLPEREAVRLVRDVAQAIAFAHQQGVVHRDLKPANILIDESGRVQVTDFGLAKQIRTHDETAVDGQPTLTRTGAILGTPSYMAPEQASGGRGKVSQATDVFSLGAILYALVTGRPPFDAPSTVDTVLALLEQDPPPPRLLNRGLSRDLEMIILRCLQKPTDLRYASAERFAADLEAFLLGEPISARSGNFSHVVARLFRETHHATVLENWGLLWMWHALVLLVICLVTNLMHMARHDWPQMGTPLPYILLWGGGLFVWAPIFWRLRRRSGPVTAVERQIAHAWGGSLAAVVLLFAVEALLGLRVLSLSPVLALVSGCVFVVKAGILSGAFYFHAAALFATSLLMAAMQSRGIEYDISVFGVISAGTFFLPGLKYYRQSRNSPVRR